MSANTREDVGPDLCMLSYRKDGKTHAVATVGRDRQALEQALEQALALGAAR